MAEEASSSRVPIHLPTYNLGDEGKPNHYDASISREAAADEAKSLTVGDAAFIKRSDLKWTYAVVTEKTEEGDSLVLRFEVDKDKNRKSFPQAQWGKYIRVIHVEESELASLQAEADKMNQLEAKAEEEAALEKLELVPSSAASADGESSVRTGKSFFSAIFSSPKKEAKKEAKKEVEKEPKPAEKAEANGSTAAAIEIKIDEINVQDEVSPKETKEEKETQAIETVSSTTASVGAEEESTSSKTSKSIFSTFFASSSKKEEVTTLKPAKAEEASKDTAPEAPRDEPDDTKENPDPVEEAPKNPVSVLRNPLSLNKSNGSLLNKMGLKKDKTSPPTTQTKILFEPSKNMIKNTVNALGDANPKSPKAEDITKKEWFDTEACEVDYDKNPTDLFQALEAREFVYADSMYKQVSLQFTKECKTWVVARGQKQNLLRFRALPLHAALVFGAPSELVKKILHAYPLAARGRDVKGRLPIHLAMEHNASEEVVALIIEAFPKGMFVIDKKNMVPLDYINGNMERVHMKKYLPLIIAAKVEEERAKWKVELAEALEEQKVSLKSDTDFMKSIVEAVTEDVENIYAGKLSLVEANYQKEIELMKKKYDSETQALLDGFEVKLNFERKLQKLKGTAR
ncbi:hypothetical protein ACHAXA_010922 [Cyclostephanos tholiformis]|uniref:Uncharacterized protein n=1 Tax=Cyclostephanos tholiformis TaxID=382380 RepID=A0ABD3R282_9STRA